MTAFLIGPDGSGTFLEEEPGDVLRCLALGRAFGCERVALRGGDRVVCARTDVEWEVRGADGYVAMPRHLEALARALT